MWKRIASGALLLAALFVLVSLLSYCRTDGGDYQAGASVSNWCGALGARVAFLLRNAFGVAILAPAFVAVVWGFLGVKGQPIPRAWGILFGVVLLTLVISLSMALAAQLLHGELNLPSQGGAVGYELCRLSLKHLGPVGSVLLAALGFVVGSALAGGSGVVALVERLGAAGRRLGRWVWEHARLAAARVVEGARKWWAAQKEVMSEEPDWDEEREPVREEPEPPPARAAAPERPKEPEPPAGEEEAPEPEPEPEPRVKPEPEPEPPPPEAEPEPIVKQAPPRAEPQPVKPPPPERKKRPRRKPKQLPLIQSGDQEEDEFELPPADLLDESPVINAGAADEDVRSRARKLEQTLAEFNIEGRVVAIEKGPVITQYEVELAPGIKVNKIVGLTDDIARSMRAVSVRVVAPIPGKSTVGVELPNAYRDVVKMRDLFYTLGPEHKKMHLPLLLGRDAAGAPLISDLTDMPHLLIAGATGSGKSVCINSIIMSLVMLHRPDQVKLLLVDPKMVELSIYKDIPHLISPVVTDMKKAAAVLEWAVSKMDERYSMMANVGVRNINSYNRLGEEGIRQRLDPENEGIDLSEVPKHLPYVVIIVDELADLMMVASKEVEASIIRLSQKSRAVGIHLIMATQRPSVDVITGLIKSNLPSRIAFQVSSKVDSRTILDRNGAEALLGRGDMLFLPPGSSKLIRAQGAFVDEHEVREVCEWLREQGAPEYSRELIQLKSAKAENPGEQDPLWAEAVRVIVESGRGSLSLLQRRLEVGYSRAARLIDMMEAAGIVGEYKGSQAREVLMTMEEYEEMFGGSDSDDEA